MKQVEYLVLFRNMLQYIMKVKCVAKCVAKIQFQMHFFPSKYYWTVTLLTERKVNYRM